MKKLTKFIGISLLICLCLSGCKSEDYKEAVALQDAGDYEAAVAIYQTITDYEDSAERIEYCNSMIAAIENYNTAVSVLTEKNTQLEEAISIAQELAYSGATAFDETLFPALETVIASAVAAKVEPTEAPSDTDAINELARQYQDLSYESAIADMENAMSELEASIAKYALVDNPSAAYVIDCLKQVEGITDIAAATEDNDPNGHLGKPGWYTAQIYFAYDLVDPSDLWGTTVMENGTSGGGSIEVYATEEDAINRDTYLASFDGGVLTSGSHTVVGTVIVRTSDNLTFSQQKELESAIIALLLGEA